MVFNSFDFAIFFSIFFLGYWLVFNRKTIWQNSFLLIACYVFYASADYRFLLFLLGVSTLNYWIGIQLVKSKWAKWFFRLGMLQGILSLFLFKYLDFFIQFLSKLIGAFGLHAEWSTLQLIAPVGISFFTFRMLSYLIDIRNEKTEPCRNPIVFFSYVAFFPSLLSGPIDKAQLLIPQLEKQRNFDYEMAVDGLRQFLWGLFKKVLVADGCVAFTNLYFDGFEDYGASTLLLGAVLYTFQIYADFSGYSDMAIGISKVMGLRITKNFDFPFFAQNIAEFWRRWHISLTSWLTEYVFTPLSIQFRDWGNNGLILAILVNFLLVGMWHGANWTFVLFGLLHGLYYIPLILTGKMNKRKKLSKDKRWPTAKELMNMSLTFILFMVSMILFKSPDLEAAWGYFTGIFDKSLLGMPAIPISRFMLIVVVAGIFVMLFVEWLQRKKDHGLVLSGVKNSFVRLAIYYGLVYLIIRYGSWDNNQFIYFQF
ncbi:MAG: MBOAT family protein [Bacteroidetes bacterium]|nr:MAG: MBOAT family protein [Bacteroidota bacterium]